MRPHLTIHDDRVPLRVEPDGAVRVGASRVLLDLVVRAFENGADPERIVRMYTTLDVADVYSVIAYYLRHQAEVQAYLQARDIEADQVRAKIEATQPAPVSRDELMRRKATAEANRAAAPQ